MLELRRLRYLVVLAKRLNYSRAAEELGLSQSALSRAIQSLERELDIRLFDRDRAGVTLTEQGRWIVEKAEDLLTFATDFEHQVGFVAQGVEGRTRFGMGSVPASALLPALAPRLQEIPGFIHEVTVADVEALWIQLALGEIEFMVCSEWRSAWPIPDGMPVRKESLGHFPLNLVARKGHPLLNADNDRRDFPLLISNRAGLSSQVTFAIRERFTSSLQLISDLTAAKALVRTTDAIWLTSAFVLADDLVSGTLAELPIPTEIEGRSFEVFVYSLARRAKSPPAIEIEALFRDQIRLLARKLSAR